MALRTGRIGSMPDIIQYDDGDYDKSMSVEDPIECTAAPVAPDDVVRLADLGSFVTGPGASTDSNLAEFSGITGKVLKDGGLSHVNVADTITKKHAQNTDTGLGALGTKNPPIDADKVIYRNSTASDALVTSTWAQVKAFLKTYFDTLYALASHAISSHSDANLAGISNNDLMQWNDVSSKWLPKSIAEVILSQSINPGPVTIGSIEDWRYAASIADDGTVALPTISANYAAKVEVILSSAGVIDANATFLVDSTGTVTPQIDSGNVVYNVDTDVKLCIGTAAAQNPLTIKNRLGGVKNIMITMMYVKA